MKSDGPFTWSTTFHEPACPTVWMAAAAVARLRIVMNRRPERGVAKAATGSITRPSRTHFSVFITVLLLSIPV
jgi:hypothetical protein